MSNTAKLAELRARTDRDLSVLLQRELDRALMLANGDPQFRANVENAYQLLNTLLLKSPDLCRGTKIESKVRELRLKLDRIPPVARTQAHPASFAACA
jgi:hypothetical protein